MPHPYRDLDARCFWSNQVGKPFLDGLWRPRFPIQPATEQFASAGSCFSNHIGAALVDAGIVWASHRPRNFPERQFASFDLGNVYTVAQLRFWLAAAHDPAAEVLTGGIVPSADGTGYCDLLRSGTAYDRFDTREALIEDRRRAARGIAEILRETGVFIFTLGLTEGWETADGLPCPICPAVRNEALQTDAYRFHREDYEEVLQGIEDCLGLAQRFNPDLRVILTVSPVPLTATATGQHVLAATTASKAVLRAAAEAACGRHGEVDYFPSYELVTTHLLPQDNFEANRRDVSPAAVALVMQHFLQGIGAAMAEPGIAAEAEPSIAAPAAPATSDTDDICDEAAYDNYCQNAVAKQEKAELVLLGSSQIGQLSQAFDRPHIVFTMNGTDFINGDFYDDQDYVLRPTEPEFQSGWENYRAAMSPELLHGGRYTIVTDIGCHSFWLPRDLAILVHLFADVPEISLSSFRADCLESFIEHFRRRALTILRRLAAAGNRIIWVADPHFAECFSPMVEDAFCRVVSDIGVQTLIRPRHIFQPGEPGLESADGYHGSALYYRRLADEICRILDRGPLPDRTSGNTRPTEKDIGPGV